MAFFKAYDMRGTYGRDFDLDVVYRVGRALPEIVGGKRWLVGRDCRGTSAAVRDALSQGLLDGGANVSDLGLCTTPMVYHFTAADDYDGSVMITASHNPPSDNGLKVSRRTALPVGYADGLDRVERRLPEIPCEFRAGRATGIRETNHSARYLEFLRGKIAALPKLDALRIGVDCSCGMSTLFARELFPAAEIINDRLDGSFPCHSPNPLDPAARAQLAALIREKKLDCGVIFDGDADRAMFLDERGEFVQPDYLIPILARQMLPRGKTAAPVKVLHDVRTSRGAIEALRELGCEPMMVPVGHAFAKPKMRETGALCGGELAGHYYFGDFHGCDSGLLAAARILGEFAAFRARGGAAFSAMLAPVMSRYANSGELNFKVADKSAAIKRVLAAAAAFGQITGRETMDGVRLEFADGWVNVRESNTEPYLRLIVEARERAELERRVDRLSAAIAAADSGADGAKQ